MAGGIAVSKSRISRRPTASRKPAAVAMERRRVPRGKT
jgi:hypothetical protein